MSNPESLNHPKSWDAPEGEDEEQPEDEVRQSSPEAIPASEQDEEDPFSAGAIERRGNLN